MADSSQTRILGKVNSCTHVGGCRTYSTLDRRRFRLRTIEMLLSLSAPCIFPLRFRTSLTWTDDWLFSLMSASCLGLRPLLPWLIAKFHLCKRSLQLIFVTLSWSATITLSFLQLAEEDCFGHVCVFNSRGMASPAQAHLKQERLYAGQAGSLEDFFVWHVVLPFDAKDGAQ